MTTPKQPDRETKSFTISVKDAEKGTVEAVFSTFGVVDHDGDITLPGAFDDGAKAAISDYGHSVWMGGKPVGKGVIRVEKDRAIMEGKFFLSTEHGREAFETVKAMGDMQEWSYGFDVLDHAVPDEEQRKLGARRILKKLKTYEVSPVFRGAGINTQTLAVKEQKPEEKAEPTPAPVAPEITEEEKQARYEITAKGRRELARFIQTMTRLAS